MRTGLGFDVHRLEPDRKLILGGIEIPYHLGLKGHSDGDVILHAISDAIAGALAEDDIGTTFPDTDESISGIKSDRILDHYYKILVLRKARILNIDIVIVAENPKLKKWYELMKKNIATLLDIDISQIGIKAKTMEGLGEIGQGKAIACLASILIDMR
ncbi:MAG TPA: 2-C-methyl-D-erythritol 2,4-cyclodiphosphate synthase [bacterium]|nr:2-C-methyl-D-erythritol 2,4-cyclodiphosphate synthase [bacterium]HOL49907.1 2-C-methyl-D-erythritol 2,4-cyclodiphosphate synthase [bacterium]HPO52510.1 2-C-methyl-D-erythritol 2,4-cyclodiphosphate synthase [bacterium]HXK45282.1 2-C-methyl-D-erythritol 2,4-cyclodiphosphate synthase [bacterium]